MVIKKKNLYQLDDNPCLITQVRIWTDTRTDRSTNGQIDRQSARRTVEKFNS